MTLLWERGKRAGGCEETEEGWVGLVCSDVTLQFNPVASHSRDFVESEKNLLNFYFQAFVMDNIYVTFNLHAP